MQITSQSPDDAALRELGTRLRRVRLERNLTQAELAEEAGLSVSTVKRIEVGESAQLGSVIRVLRALGLLDRIDRLVPEPTARPVERLRRAGRERQRASKPRAQATERAPWQWDE